MARRVLAPPMWRQVRGEQRLVDIELKGEVLLSMSKLTELLTRPRGPCATIYMPTHRAGAQKRQDPIRWSNLLKRAESALGGMGATVDDIDASLEPARKRTGDGDFWLNQRDGLAAFLSPERHEFLRLPCEFAEKVACGRRHAIRPLLPYLQQQRRFFVLALSQHGTRFYESDPPSRRLQRRRLACDDLHIADMVGERSTDATLQYRSANSPAAQQRGDAPVFHGQTPRSEKSEADLKRFCDAIDTEVRAALKGESAPLILAAVDYVAAMYRLQNGYPHLAQSGIDGNPDGWSEDELGDLAREIARDEGRQRVSQMISDVADHLGQPTASHDIRIVLPAAASGAVATLLIDRQGECRGQYDSPSESQEVACRDDGNGEDLLEYAAAETIIHGGKVAVVDEGQLPTPSPLLALLRHPL